MAGSPMPRAVHLIARLAAGGMRDAESMLDQLLSAAPERIDEATVRDLLGLADAEVVDTFVDHLVRGDGAAGVALLETLDERGRDVRALLDQAVDTIRAELMAASPTRPACGTSRPHSPQPVAGSPRSTRTGPASAASASSWSSRCSRREPRRRATLARSRPARRLRPPPRSDRPRSRSRRRRPSRRPRGTDHATPAPPAAQTRSTRGKETPAHGRGRGSRSLADSDSHSRET